MVLGCLVLAVWSTAPDRGCDRIAVAISSFYQQNPDFLRRQQKSCVLSYFYWNKKMCEDTTHTRYTPPMRDKWTTKSSESPFISKREQKVLQYLSHQILRHIHRVVNIDERKN
jgi:hypothetical protein